MPPELQPQPYFPLPDPPRRKSSPFNRFLVFLAVLLSILIVFLYFSGMGMTPIVSMASGADTYGCVPLPPQPSSNKQVILRIDDVQAYGWTNISMEMMKDAFAKGFPVVAAVIPINLSENATLLQFLDNNHCNIEVAMHGYTHHVIQNGVSVSGPEFGDLTQSEAAQKIQLGEAILFKNLPFLTKQNLTTFIPPNNVISDPAREAVTQAGFDVISAQGTGKYDYDASSWNYTTNTFSDAQDVINECETTFQTKNFCVIMIHPQNYADAQGNLNQTEYQSYLQLLDAIKQAGYTVTTFQKISSGS
ncbi:MAG TPA: DUF2334 domain-containing protein [Candidatus Paceibacterota bacterium]|nr:DUF2334 domain-containing protein [Candidatus Paceibacterota bacterium]